MSEKPVLSIGSGGTSSVKKRKIHITFVFDTTASLDQIIEALKQTCSEFVIEPSKYNLAPSFSLISFGDLEVFEGGDRIEVEVHATDSIETIRQKLKNIRRNSGFGNNGESSFEALVKAAELHYEPDTVKVLILITDEPAHQTHYTPSQIIGMLKEGNFLVYTVAPANKYYKDIAHQNGGEWVEIGASSRLDHVKKLFEKLASQVALMSRNVHKLGKGNVQETIRLLGSGKKE